MTFCLSNGLVCIHIVSCLDILQAERAFQDVQAIRRQRQHDMSSVQSKLKEIHAQLDKVQRGDERYLALLTEEYEIIKEEKKIISELGNYEQLERDNFSALSSAVRESHERERARAERTRYWSVIGSVIGAAIGIIGTSINNHLRMHELKRLVKESATGGSELKGVVGQLSESMKMQHDQVHSFISELKSIDNTANGFSEGLHRLQHVPDKLSQLPADFGTSLEAQTKQIIEFVKEQDEALEVEIKEIKKLLAVGSDRDVDKAVVYVGPEIEKLLEKTESNLEWKMKTNAALMSALVYGACILSLSVLYNIFRGGSAS